MTETLQNTSKLGLNLEGKQEHFQRTSTRIVRTQNCRTQFVTSTGHKHISFPANQVYPHANVEILHADYDVELV